MKERVYYIYIVSSPNNRAIYIGVCKNLLNRINQHKTKRFQNSFSQKYNCHKLVYFEIFHDIKAAIKREKQLKNWHREWKNNMIADFNPDWSDLYDVLDTPAIERYLKSRS